MQRSFVAELAAPGHKVPVRACDLESNAVWLFASIGEYPVYDDVAYEVMIKDERRMNRYSEAVRRYAPGRTVLDIGTGQDAVWALAAARAGARHVWAVEVIPRSTQIARKNIEQAGFADRITVVEGLSTEIELPSPSRCVSPRSSARSAARRAPAACCGTRGSAWCGPEGCSSRTAAPPRPSPSI
ncbi:50S ribosomal protein L11 methyltransferase [Streptomyces malaysiensis]|uniref:50S ribosomal protein L11 methyltransferase n=1 Tax=Streptomyces malaysiensis TaxID=92644 RepID=UPI002B2B43BF|nr:50S ribosomal protein L11 methyltransferase [Streptomyces malaysiensis]